MTGTKIGYARCSTVEQNVEDQVRRLEADGCTKVFADIGVSGKLSSRPEWDRALEYLRPDDTLIVTKLDRCGRSVAHLIELATKLHDRDIHLRVLDQQIDTATAMGKLFYTILGAFAEFERNLIVERTHEGLRTARANGHKSGRREKLTPRQQSTVRQLHGSGTPISHIAETFGVSRPLIYRVLEKSA